MVHDEAVKEFLVESQEGLETNPDARDRITVIFRTVHTVKGTSGFLGYALLQGLTHAGESLLARLRDGALRATPEMTAALLALVDRVRAILKNIEATGGEGAVDVAGKTAWYQVRP